jgi:hypothetical protein
MSRFAGSSSIFQGQGAVTLTSKYAWICGDVIRVENFWREVLEIAEAGSSLAKLLTRGRRTNIMVSIAERYANNSVFQAPEG